MSNKDTIETSSPLDIFSMCIENSMIRNAGDNVTIEQKQHINWVANQIHVANIINEKGIKLIVPSDSCTSEELESIKATLKLIPNTFIKIFGREVEQKPIILGLIPISWRKIIDGRSLIGMGEYFGKESLQNQFDILQINVGSANTGIYEANAILVHEIFHIQLASRLPSKSTSGFPTFVNEGLAELIFKMFNIAGEDFLKNPVKISQKLLETGGEKMLTKKGAIAFPLLVPTIFSIMPSGSYAQWVKDYFVNNASIDDGVALDWFQKAENSKDNPRTALRAVFQYGVSIATTVGILKHGISLDKYAKDLISNYSVEQKINKYEALLYILNSYGLSKTDIVKLSLNQAQVSLEKNYSYNGDIGIVQHYLDIIDPLLNGCTKEQALMVGTRSGIEWL